jgi:hypothetical protein
MMNWKTIQPTPPAATSILEIEDFRLCVKESLSIKKRWQHFVLSFGFLSDNEHAKCVETWPTEAIRIAREKLDRLEQRLNEEDQ